MIDDLVKLEAPYGTHAIRVTFHLNEEEDVLREAERRDKRVTYLPDETDRKSVFFDDDSSGVSKTFISKADPR